MIANAASSANKPKDANATAFCRRGSAALCPLCGPLALLKRAPAAFQDQRDFVLRMLAAAFRQMMDRKQLVVANRSVP
jgi:hypothetical protein